MDDLPLTLDNACVIVSMRELLDDPTWGPRDIATLIYQNQGLPMEFNYLLEQYAPVTVLNRCSLEGNPTAKTVTLEGGRVLTAQEKIAIVQRTSPGRLHMECLTVEAFISQRITELAALIVRRESEAPDA